jgi:hypothetical protein
MAKCSSCKQEKDSSFFHRDIRKKSNCSSYCKQCKKIKDATYERNFVYSQMLKNRKDDWRKKYPERKNAQAKVSRAIKKGTLIKQLCFMCGDKAEAHHPDYSRPLDVVWLCPSHHRQAHLILGESND